MLSHGLPFVPAHQDESGMWWYSCTQLGRDGRCRSYEDRPQLCRVFEPGEDPLCVHYWADPEDPRIAKGERPVVTAESAA